jgi:predicted deacylase
MRHDHPGAARRAAAPLVCLLLLPTLALAAAAAPLDAAGRPQWVARVWNDVPVRIELPDQAALAALLARVPVASFDREQVAFVAAGPKSRRVVWQPRVTEAEAAALTAAGVAFERLRDVDREGREAMEAAWAGQAAEVAPQALVGEKGIYHTQAQIGQLLQQAQLDHPAIAAYYSLGNSIQGRPLHAIVISDQVGVEEAEPEVRLAATIHGDEPVQMENLVTLVEYLTSNYGVDPVVTDLVDHTEIHIVPCLNPDGNVAGSRFNANGQDLNRDYPVPDGSPGDDGSYVEELETVLVKNHGAARHFVLSEVGHGGALVTNYLWDHTYTRTSDDAGLQQTALEYSQYNLPMYSSSTFPLGITNGADWYDVKGSLQDWAYQATGCWDFTIEVGDVKTPAASQLDGLWNDNRESLLHFIRVARYGVHGLVTASGTGLPLPATVTVTGISKPVVTDPDFGDYYKLLPTGVHELTFAAPGCTPRTFSGVVTTWGTETVLNVQLDPIAWGDVSGTVRNLALEGLAATLTVTTWPLDEPVTTLASDAGAGGGYTAHLAYGEYTFRVAAAGYATVTRRVTLDTVARAENFTLSPVEESDLVANDFEGGTGAWTGGTWGLSTVQAYSPTHSLADSPIGSYTNNATNIVTLAPVNLAGITAGTVSFRARWDIEANWDAVFFEASTDGGAVWTPLETAWTQPAAGQGGQIPAGAPLFEGTQTAWTLNSVDLAPWLGLADVRFRFRLRSDTSQVYDGFYCDDFVIHVARPAVTGAETPPVAVRLELSAAPNPFNPRTELRFVTTMPGAVSLALFDARGRCVRTLLAGAGLPAGPHAVLWDGADARGARVPSGVYFARIVAAGAIRTVKVALVQ